MSNTTREAYGVHVCIHTAGLTQQGKHTVFTFAYILLVQHNQESIQCSRLHTYCLSNTTREAYGVHVCIYTACPTQQGKHTVFTSASILLVQHIKGRVWCSGRHPYCLPNTSREAYSIHVCIHTACSTHHGKSMVLTFASILLVRHIKRTIWRSRQHSYCLSDTLREQYGVHVCIHTACQTH